MESKPSMPKAIAIGVLAFLAHQLLYFGGVYILAFRDYPSAFGTTVGELLQQGFVSGVAAYGVFYAASAWFSNLHLRVLVATFLVVLATTYAGLVRFTAQTSALGPRSPIVLQVVVAIVAATIGAFIFLRREGHR
jgi:hypothetical protein